MRRRGTWLVLMLALPAWGQTLEARPRLRPDGRIEMQVRSPWPDGPQAVRLVPGQALSAGGMPLVETTVQGLPMRARIPAEWIRPGKDGALLATRRGNGPAVTASSDPERPVLLDDPRAAVVADALRARPETLVHLDGRYDPVAGAFREVTLLGVGHRLGASAWEYQYLALEARARAEVPLRCSKSGDPLATLPPGGTVLPTGRRLRGGLLEVVVPLDAGRQGALVAAVAPGDVDVRAIRAGSPSQTWDRRPPPAKLRPARSAWTQVARDTPLMGRPGSPALTLRAGQGMMVVGGSHVDPGLVRVQLFVPGQATLEGWVRGEDLAHDLDGKPRKPTVGAAQRLPLQGE